MAPMPALFVSHGAPTLAIEDGPAHRFLAAYGAMFGRAKAVLAISAHWETAAPAVTSAESPATIHDFYGFPRALYRIRYPAPGDPALADRVAGRLEQAGLPTTADDQRGLDHGAWVPLSLMFPDADVPVVQLSIQTALGPQHHYRLGAALAPLRDDGVLIMGSGGMTHNLGEFRGRRVDEPPPGWVVDFAEWTAAALADGRIDDLLDYRDRAPHAARNHPTDEHFLPLFAAIGAAGPAARVQRVHASHSYGVLAMDAFAFS